MALIALAADKGAPGVTTAAVALGAVWPRPVLLAECDAAGGDLVYRLPAEGGGMLNPARGMLSLAVTARRGLAPERIGEHTQRLAGGLDVLIGPTNSEQSAGLTWLWGPLGRAFAAVPGIDVLADCGRLGANTPLLDLLQEAAAIVLFTRATLEHVAHLRERINALAAKQVVPAVGVVVVADPRTYRSSLAEVGRVIASTRVPATVLGGFAIDARGAEMLSGQWSGRLDRTLLIRSARELAGNLATRVGVPPASPAPRVESAGGPAEQRIS